MDSWISGLLDDLGIRASGDAQVTVGGGDSGARLDVSFGERRYGGAPVWAWVVGALLVAVILQLRG